MTELFKLISRFIKAFNFPHPIKYLFFLILKGKKINTISEINSSEVKMHLNLGDFIDYWIYMDGSYEERWIRKIKNLINAKLFIDIGANIGIYSLSLCKNAKYIYAFEPEKESFKRLENNIKLNHISNIKAVNMAVSDHDNGSATLYVNCKDRGWSSLKMHHIDGAQNVKLTSIDSFFRKNDMKDIGLIKIDVEGSELDILKGGFKTLQKLHCPVLIEFNYEFSKLSGYNLSHMYQIMKDLNYKAYGLKSGQTFPLKISDLYKGFNDNVLFI